MKRKKHLTDCKMACLFKKKRPGEIRSVGGGLQCQPEGSLAAGWPELPVTCTLPGQGQVLHSPQSPSTAGEETGKKPQRVCCRNSSVLGCPEGQDPRAAAQCREVPTHSTGDPGNTDTGLQQGLPSNCCCKHTCEALPVRNSASSQLKSQNPPKIICN